VSYIHTEPPFDPKDLPEYLSRELQQLETVLTPDSWIDATLLNSWVRYSATFAPAQFMKDAAGWVHIRGLIKGGTVTNGTLLFNLPVGYRPLYYTIFHQLSNNVSNRVDVRNDGNLAIASASVDVAWLSLDNIHFLAEG